MTIKEFRKKIKPKIKLIIENQEFFVKEVIKYRFDDGSYYIKCILNDDYIFADDDESNAFILGKDIEMSIQEPFPKTLNFKNKKFTFLYTAHAKAEEVYGEKIFKKGYSESFWDYKASDDSYISLGIIDSNKKRLDMFGKIIKLNDVNIGQIS